MKIEFRLANHADAHRVADNLREEDRRECASLTSSHPRSALAHSVSSSRLAIVVVIDDEPVALFGVSDVPGNPDVGQPWLMATPGLLRAKREFIRQSRDWLHTLAISRPYKTLRNLVDMRNTLHVRWLKWLGAKFHGDEVMQHFRRFEIKY